jgi:LuxR family maltose regulon positive regulatory protein
MGEQQEFPGSNAATDGSKAAAGTRPLIVTKIRVPRRRRDLLPRRRLVDFIHDHLDRRLILISAPAGFGKTSLLTDFASDTDLPVCWYTLDPFDRDLHLFLEHIISAIAHRFPDFGQRSRTFLQQTSDPGANLYPLVATLVQEIYDTIPEYFFLVLDDHHTVEDQEQINEFLDLFVTYVDENCHLIIASRTLPALPNLSLLVARRDAAGLSIDELRFTPHEIRALAKQNYNLELSPEQATTLAERTGGWITGLLLTTAHRWAQASGEVTVRGRINVDIYDYLSRQVLDRQPAPLRDFLLTSSVLDELSPELCADVLQIDRPVALMDQVRIRNLFAIEFEGDDYRLRYHDLFRDFLRDTLRQQSQARFHELTLRAAATYARRGEWERAVSRYLLLEEHEQAASLIERLATHMHETGRWDTLAGWIDSLPQVVRLQHPKLLVQRGKIYGDRGEHALALALYDRAEEAFAASGDQAGAAHSMAMKGYALRFQGMYAEAITQSRQALARVEGGTRLERFTMALAHRNTGLCHFRQGQISEGRQALEEALQIYETLHEPYDVGMVNHDLGLGHELMGDLGGASAHYQAALQCWRQLGNPAPWANTLNGLGVVYHLQGRYEEALKILEQALRKAQQARDLRVEAFAWASLGDLHRDLGAHERARQAYTQAAEVAAHGRVGFILTYAALGLGTICRLNGDLDQAAQQLQKALDLASQHGSGYETGLCHTALGLLAAEQDDLVTARSYFDQAVERFQAAGFQRDLAEACLHRAQLAFLASDRQAALVDLQQALDLANQLGFDQFFVVQGRRLSELLSYAQQQGIGEGVLPALLERIQAHQARLEARPEPVVRAEPQQALKIHAFGSPRVELDGKSIQWTTVQSRDLFFCLLQHPQGLRKEEIGSLFWPDHPPPRLDGIFRSTLYRLRRSVFRESVIYEDGVYRFNRDTDYWFDADTFEELLDQADQSPVPARKTDLLEEAVTLYQGDYLAGVYADWCALERERLRERHLSALEALAGLHAARGNLQRAIQEYQQLVAQDPYREPVHRELMRCHYRLGDRAAAIRQYQDCSQVLRDDLGLSPEPETDELYLQIIG